MKDLLIIVGAIIFLVIMFNLVFSGGNNNSSSRDTTAYVCAIDVVENHLKAPSTAKFCGYTNAKVTSLGDDRYKVTGYVDSQNSFGANIRSTFTVTLTLTSSGYKDAYCSIN